MALRNRSFSLPGPSGTVKIGSSTFVYTSNASRGTCQDTNGSPKTMNPLFLEKWSNSQVVINGVRGAYTYKNTPVSSSSTLLSAAAPKSGWSPSYKYSVAQAMASSHPGEPAVSVPNFLFELKDMPGMLKHLAGKLGKKFPKRPPKSAADDYLAYTFGWAPLISDIMSIYDVAKWCDSRARYIRRIRSHGFATRRGQRGSDSVAHTLNSFSYNSRGEGFSGTANYDTVARAWVTTRWRLNQNLPLDSFISNERHRLLAAALGLDIGFQTFWDAMPWTWLVDYFTDLSSIISVHKNRSGFVFAGGCAMENIEVRGIVTPKQYAPLHLGTVVQSYSSKRRVLSSPTLADVGINFLSGRQLATLTALFVSRSSR